MLDQFPAAEAVDFVDLQSRGTASTSCEKSSGG
jgi:hypothetical protein